MNNFIPDIYAKNIFLIDYSKLKERGIKCLLFDLDNTISPMNVLEPTKDLIDLLHKIEDMGFKIIILSNSGIKRVTPFKEKLNVDSAYRSFKPLPFKYQKILRTYHFKVCEVASIGDQILTDVLGANQMGITSIFVEQLANDTFFGTKINRMIEKSILHNLNRRGIYEKGKYYD